MAKDLLLGDDDDLDFVAGDLVAGDADSQDVGLILRTNQGDWRQSPLVGFGSEVGRDQFVRDLDTQLRLDGFEDNHVALAEDGTLTIKALRHE